MPDLIPFLTQQLGTETVQTVNARDLYTFLELSGDYTRWINSAIKRAHLLENVDFIIYYTGVGNTQRGPRPIDHHLTFDAAKHVAMMASAEKGHEVRAWFIAKEKELAARNASPQIPPPQEQLDVLQSCVQALKALGCFDDRDVISFGAYYRRIAAAVGGDGPEHLGQQGTSQPVLWTMSMRLQFLKYPPLTGKEGEGQQIKIGSRAAKLHASTYGEAPKKLWDYVKGQQRQVNGYLPERVDVLDQAIFSVLGPPRLQILPGKE